MAINTGTALTETTPETAETTLIQATPGEITLPEGFSLASADFARVGADLVLTAPDGAQIVIRDFFALGELPELVSAEGAHIPGELAVKLAGPLAPGQVAQVAQAGPGISPEPIGQVENVDGEVVAIRPDGTRVELEVGDPVYQGDVLESGEDGAIGIVLADETSFSMAENGRMVLDEMVYDPGTQEGTIALSIVQGVFTFISGEVAKADPDAMTVQTPVATIGIRGTQMGITYQEGEELQLVLMEEADGFVGEIVVQNEAGVQILNQANQGVTVTSIDEAPSQPETVSPEAIAETYGKALLTMPASANVNDYGAEETAAGGEDENLEDFATAAGGEENDITGGEGDIDLTGGGAEDELVVFVEPTPILIAFEPEPEPEPVSDDPDPVDPIFVDPTPSAGGSGEFVFINGFESGDFTGWQTIGSTSVVSGDSSFGPTEGSSLAHLTASGASQSSIESFLGLNSGSLDSLNGNATDGSAITATVTVKAGDVVSIDWMFDANDYMPYNDFSFAAVIDDEVIDLSELSDVADVGNYGDSGWKTFSFTATEDGDVDIGLGVMNMYDTALDPHLLVDNLRVNDPDIDVSPSVDIA